MANKLKDSDKKPGKPLIDDAAGSSDASYAVGYRKPPAATRFQKGRSGNPRGRPKKKAPPKHYKFQDGTFDNFLQDEIFRTVRATENGQTIEMPVTQAIQRRFINLALSGNRIALQRLLELVQEKEETHFASKIERYEHIAKLKREGEATLAECQRKGIPPPELIPHPDDIELIALTGDVIFHGPTTPREARKWEYYVKLRNYLFCNAVRACNGINFFKEVDGKPCMHAGWFQAYSIDTRILPRRYRSQEWTEASLALRCNGPKREWARRMAAEKAWLDANYPVHATSKEFSEETITLLKLYFHSGLANAWLSLEFPEDLPASRESTLTTSFNELAAFWRDKPTRSHAI